MKLFCLFGALLVLSAVTSADNEITEEDNAIFEKCIEYSLAQLLWGDLVPRYPGYYEIVAVGDDNAEKSVLKSEEDGPKLYNIKEMQTNVTFTCPDCSVDPCCRDKVWNFLNCSAGCLVAEGENDYGVKFAYGFELDCSNIPELDCSFSKYCPSDDESS